MNQFNFKLDDAGFMEICQDCLEIWGKELGFWNCHELGECSVASQVVPHCANVLEIGGGRGKVSHIINKRLAESGLERRQVVVECDTDTVTKWLEPNRGRLGDSYTIISKPILEVTVEDLAVLGGAVDAMIVDCEGCLLDLEQSDIGKHIYSKLRWIVNEMDGWPNKEEITAALRNAWTDMGFVKVAKGYSGAALSTQGPFGGACDVWYRDV